MRNEFASQTETCISSIFLVDRSSLQLMEAGRPSLSPVHALNVRLVVGFQLFALQLEGVCH